MGTPNERDDTFFEKFGLGLANNEFFSFNKQIKINQKYDHGLGLLSDF